jgi:hypothetical protein
LPLPAEAEHEQNGWSGVDAPSDEQYTEAGTGVSAAAVVVDRLDVVAVDEVDDVELSLCDSLPDDDELLPHANSKTAVAATSARRPAWRTSRPAPRDAETSHHLSRIMTARSARRRPPLARHAAAGNRAVRPRTPSCARAPVRTRTDPKSRVSTCPIAVRGSPL